MTDLDPPPGSGITVNLSLVSHTNAGKTTLARTLLGRDIGEARDAAHVTDLSSGHVLVQNEDDTLMRGLLRGRRTARLLSRLGCRQSIGWFRRKVWDGARAPLWSSQRSGTPRACPVSFMLVTAAGSASSSYVALERKSSPGSQTRWSSQPMGARARFLERDCAMCRIGPEARSRDPAAR